jgi:hypothetical protein
VFVLLTADVNGLSDKGIKQLQEQAKQVKTWPAFMRFMLMGEHAGIRKYMLGTYKPSNGTGW